MMEADLIGKIAASVSISAIVADRVTPLARTQGAELPAVVVQRIGGGPEMADDGSAGIQGARVQVDCWGRTYAEAKDLSGVVIAELNATMDEIHGSTTFIYIILEEARDLREPGYNNPEYFFRTSLDFMVWTNF